MSSPKLRKVAMTMAVAVLLFIGYVGYSAYAEGRAKDQAQAFCATVKVGDATDSLLQRAIASGADQRHTRWFSPPNEDRWLPVTYIGTPPFSRHMCSIKATNTVVSAQYSYLD